MDELTAERFQPPLPTPVPSTKRPTVAEVLVPSTPEEQAQRREAARRGWRDRRAA